MGIGRSKIAKTSNCSMRIEPNKKSSLELLYGELGITLADAVNIFLKNL